MATDHFVNYCWERKKWTETSVTGSDFGHDWVLSTSFSQIDNWATQVRPGRWLFNSFFSALWLTKWSRNISRTICIFFIRFLSQRKTWTLTVSPFLQHKSGRILYFSNIDFFKVNKFPPVGAWLNLPRYQGYCSHNPEVETQSPFQSLIWHTGQSSLPVFQNEPMLSVCGANWLFPGLLSSDSNRT